LKKLVTLGLAIMALFAMTAVAVAQPAPLDVKLTGKVTPSKGGTKKKPKNAKITLAFTVNPESQKTVDTIEFFIPRNIVFSGTGFATCTADEINQVRSDADCPKAAKLGQGTASAILSGGGNTPINFVTTVYAASKNEIALYLRATGIDVSVAFKGLINKAGLPYGQKLTVQIPESVQIPLKGPTPETSTYAYITGVSTTIGGVKSTTGKGKKKKTNYFASLTGCPKSKSHATGVRLHYIQTPASPEGTSDLIRTNTACKK